MDFIPPIVNPAHPPLSVPWFSPSSKVYATGGYREWLFYPHYEGYNIQHIAEGDFHGNTWTDTAGFIQRWAYWGMIMEIFHIGGLTLGSPGLSNLSGAEQLQSLSSSLPYMIMLWKCVKTDPAHPDREQIELERFVKINTILRRVNLFFTMLCGREFSALSAGRHEDKADQKPHDAQLAYAKHSHQHEKVDGDWDARFVTGLPEKKSFFSEEPLGSEDSSAPAHRLESPGHALILSIGVAGELLCRATEQKYGRTLEGLKWTIPLTIVRRAELAGWCRIWLRRFREEGSLIRAYYLSAISKGPADRHAHCCTFGCVASQVNPVTYQMKHRTGGCGCPVISFEVAESSTYASWIKAGHTPLIKRGKRRPESDSGDAESWKLIQSHDPQTGKATEYVAVSHVWADGTGSRDGNSLHSCQLDKFQDAVTELYGGTREADDPTPFWVDTISVPFKSCPLKMLALRQMEQVYREADCVLVFDSGLQQVPLGTPAHECLTRIEISSWNGRLWTIQEAVFAKKLYFKFKDGMVSLQNLVLRYRYERFARIGAMRYGEDSEGILARMPLLRMILDEQLSPVLKEGEHRHGGYCRPTGISHGDWLALDSDALKGPISEVEMDGLRLDNVFFGSIVAVYDFFHTLRESQPRSESAQIKWSSLEKVLPYRQTSIAKDEGLCIATLLGMDLKALYDLQDEERLRRMFLYIGTINSSILFGDRPRLEQPGYRWMPTSFVGHRTATTKSIAHVTEAGIKVKLPMPLVEFPPGQFMLDTRPGNVNGSFGYLELDPDDEDGPGYLVAGSFPIRLCGTGQVFIVNLTMPDGNAGIITSGSGTRIILEESLPSNSSLETGASMIQRVFREWEEAQKSLQSKGS